jgi:hypothetical protein
MNIPYVTSENSLKQTSKTNLILTHVEKTQNNQLSELKEFQNKQYEQFNTFLKNQLEQTLDLVDKLYNCQLNKIKVTDENHMKTSNVDNTIESLSTHMWEKSDDILEGVDNNINRTSKYTLLNDAWGDNAENDFKNQKSGDIPEYKNDEFSQRINEYHDKNIIRPNKYTLLNDTGEYNKNELLQRMKQYSVTGNCITKEQRQKDDVLFKIADDTKMSNDELSQLMTQYSVIGNCISEKIYEKPYTKKNDVFIKSENINSHNINKLMDTDTDVDSHIDENVKKQYARILYDIKQNHKSSNDIAWETLHENSESSTNEHTNEN